MTLTQLRRKKDRMYGVVPSGDDYYAFWSDGRAGLYVDGSFVSYRSTTGPSIPEAPTLIHEDDQAIVGPGSIVTRVDSNALQVWDVEGDAIYDYTASAGYVVSPALYADGFLWWIEREETQHGGTGTHATYWRLRKARTDLSTDLTTVYTYEAAHYVGFSVLWSPIQGIALTTAGVLCQCHWNDEAAGETQDEYQLRIERDGGGATDNGWPAIGPGTIVDRWAFNAAPLTANGIGAGAISTGFLAGIDDDPEVSPTAFWAGDEWQAGTPSNTSVDAAGEVGALYDGATLVRGPAEAGTPTAIFAVNEGPDFDRPAYMFLKG